MQSPYDTPLKRDFGAEIGLHACRYGDMLAFTADDVITRSLHLYGEWAEHELQCLRPYVIPGTTVIDVGANIGTHTLAFSHWVGSGSVLAIEAQPVVSSVLTVNCLLNRRSNIEVVTAVCGGSAGWADIPFDYRSSGNFGAASFGDVTAAGRFQQWRWRRRLQRKRNLVRVAALDELTTGLAVSLVKMDIEGMEYAALCGAQGLLRRQRPVLYLEQLNTTNLKKICDVLGRLDYRLYWLETHPYNQNNYRKTVENIWWRTETGILAVSSDEPVLRDLVEVRRADAAVPALLDARVGIYVPGS